MATIYPAKIDTTTSLPTVIDNTTPVQGAVVNRLRDAIIAIEAELGPRPAGTYATVRSRLDAVEANQVSFNGDLSGTVLHQTVIGLQGRPVSGALPSVGQILGWNGSAWLPIINNGGTGAFTPSGDLGGTGISQIVVGIRTVPVSVSLPNTANQVLLYDGAQYAPTIITQDMIAPGFNITAFGTGQIVEVGETITAPAFTASYSVSPDSGANSVVLTDDQSNPPKDVSATPTSFSSDNSYTKNTFNATVSWTDTAKKGTITRTSTTTAFWWQNNYYGKGASGQTSQSFIKSLTGFLTNGRGTTFSQTTAPDEYIYYCYRTAYGAATFTVGGFSGGFNLIATTSVTNDHGFTENYFVYQSSNDNLGATTVVVS